MSDFLSVYSKNETMRIIGRNSYYAYVTPGGEYKKQFTDVLKAYEGKSQNDPIALYWDIFALGMICGIKEQRKRYKQKRNNDERQV